MKRARRRKLRRRLAFALSLLVAISGALSVVLPEGSLERNIAAGVHAVGGAVQETVKSRAVADEAQRQEGRVTR
jgi:hypothetical protein